MMLYIRLEGHKSSKLRAGKFHSKLRTGVVAIKNPSPIYINAEELQIGASWHPPVLMTPARASWHPQGVPLLYCAPVGPAMPLSTLEAKNEYNRHLWERGQI